MDTENPSDLAGFLGSGPKDGESTTPALRLCTYHTRSGFPCPHLAEPNSLVCKAHGSKKATLSEIRRMAADLGPIAVSTLEDVMLNGSFNEKTMAVKVWSGLSGVENANIVQENAAAEELEQARASLSQKLESVISRLASRKMA